MTPNRAFRFLWFPYRVMAAALSLTFLAIFWYWAGKPIRVEELHPEKDFRLQSVSYTPLIGDESPRQFKRGEPVPEKRIREDLFILSRRFSAIRTYSTIRLETLPALAAEYGMKVLLGAWVSSDPAFTQRELQEVIQIARRYPEAVSAVIVGNEALLRQEVTGDQLAGYIRQVKSALPGIPVTYADVWEFWIKHPEVAPAVDFITIHILPYWEDNPVSIDEAMNHIQDIRAKMSSLFPDKEILIGETGWPSQGRMRRGALPGLENQARFIRGFVSLAEQKGWRYNLIEAFDQPWKRKDEGAVGGFWGLYDSNRQDKNVLFGPVSAFRNWWECFLLSAGIILAGFLVAGTPPGNGLGRLFFFSVSAAGGAVLWVLQYQQYTIISRNPWEVGWAGMVLGQGFFLYLLTLRSLAVGLRTTYASFSETISWLRPFSRMPSDRNRHDRQPIAVALSIVRVSVILFSLIAAMGLLLDSRYRSFQNTGFLLSALSLTCLQPYQPIFSAGKSMERIIAFLLGATGMGILILESYHNHQAVVWCAVCLLLAIPLWRESKGSPLFRYMWGMFPLAGSYWVLSIWLREFLHNLGDCAHTPAEGMCLIRTMLGMMMYDQVFGISSLVLCALAVWINRPIWLVFSMAGGAMAVILYNADMGVVSLILSAFALLAFIRTEPSSRNV